MDESCSELVPTQSNCNKEKGPNFGKKKGLNPKLPHFLLNALQAQLQKYPKVTLCSTHGFMDLSTSSILLPTVVFKNFLYF